MSSKKRDIAMLAKDVTHTAQVKAFFEAPEGYFARRSFDIQIRRTTVDELVGAHRCRNILDVGCGDGSISIPLLDMDERRHLTLLDVSQAMLDRAQSRLSPQQRSRTRVIHTDLLEAGLDQKFDLILCLGVLAHVDSPEKVLQRLRELLKPGGRLILEVTDSYHPVGRLLAAYHWLLSLVRPTTYSLNRLRIRDVFEACRLIGFVPVRSYRYALPPPGSQRIFSHETLFKVTRRCFGTVLDNRLSRLGNIAIGEFSG
jgi:2-polyprenyl-3-methyl-5-hydroxy-6-metoxy-1,4-benzoquinol methylase